VKSTAIAHASTASNPAHCNTSADPSPQYGSVEPICTGSACASAKPAISSQATTIAATSLPRTTSAAASSGASSARTCCGWVNEYRRFALENESLYALMFERAVPGFVPGDASRRSGLGAFQELVARAGDVQAAHLLWCAMHGMVSIELTHRRWGGPVMDHLQADPEATFVSAMETLRDALRRAR
jgi:hypothetical protein